MVGDWNFPEPNTHLERELGMSESLLPDEIKVERGDVVQRAQTEWHFLVLSNKLHEAYKGQLEELKEKVENLTKYDQGMWDSLKEFWGKVQGRYGSATSFVNMPMYSATIPMPFL